MLYYRFVWLIVGIVVMVGGVHAAAQSRRRDNSLSPLTPRSLRPISILPRRQDRHALCVSVYNVPRKLDRSLR